MIAKSSSLLSAWILSATLLLGGCASLPETSSSAYPAGLAAVLPNTDGYGLLAKPAPLPEAVSKQAYAQAKQSCDTGCATPAGKLLGVATRFQAIPTASRLVPSSFFRTCAVAIHYAKPPADKQLHYVGLSYQCVEYARRWDEQPGITFGDVDSAHDILYLTEGENIHTDGKFPLARSINGTAKRPPKRGDLLIYYPNPADPKWRHGHVAVVVGVDLQHGWVNVAEQNYNNLPWAQPNRYARQLRLFEVGGRYHIADVASDKTRNPVGGLVSGWIYPASAQ